MFCIDLQAASQGHLSGKRSEKVVTVDPSCVNKDALFRVESVPLPNPTWQGKGDFYRLTLDDELELQVRIFFFHY